MTDFTSVDQVLDAALADDQVPAAADAPPQRPPAAQVALLMLDQALAGLELQVHAARQAVVLLGMTLDAGPAVDSGPAASGATSTARVPNVPTGQTGVNTFDD